MVNVHVLAVGDVHVLRSLRHDHVVLGNFLVDVPEFLAVLTAQRDDALVGDVLPVQGFAVNGNGLEGALQLRGSGYGQDGRGRGDLGVVRSAGIVRGDLPVGVEAHNVVGAFVLWHSEREGGLAAAGILEHVQLLPAVAVQVHVQILEIVEVAVLEGGAVGLGRYRQLRAGADGVGVLVEAGERAAAGIKAPVGEHGHVPGIPVGQQNVVRGGTPAGTHVGIAVVPVVHQVLVMPPEVGHVETGGRAGDFQRGQRSRVGRVFVHVVNIVVQPEALQIAAGVLALAALVFGKTDEVALQQIDVQVQAGGPLHDVVVHVLALAVCRVIAVELVKAVLAQVEVRDGNGLMAQNCAVTTPDGHAVVGDGHINRDLLGGGLVVVVLGVQAVGGGLDRDGEGRGDGLAARAGGLDLRLVGAGVFFRHVQRASADLGLGAELGGVDQRIGQRVAVRIPEDVPQGNFQQVAGHHFGSGGGVRLDAYAGIRRPRRDDAHGQ